MYHRIACEIGFVLRKRRMCRVDDERWFSASCDAFRHHGDRMARGVEKRASCCTSLHEMRRADGD